MSLVSLAISVLWLLIGVIVLCGIVWFALYVVKMFLEIPALIEKAIWVVVLILVLIGALTLLAGGGGGIKSFRLSAADIPTVTYAATINNSA